MSTEEFPTTLVEAVRYFSDLDICLKTMVALRWPHGVVCPRCGSREVTFLAKARVWKCRTPHRQQKFSVKVGTVMEDSPIGLDKWLPAIWLIVNAKNDISSYELHRALGVTQKTAWFLLHRIRLAMQDKDGGLLSGQVEVDETFIGGSSRFMHKSKREKVVTGRGTGATGKTPVMGLLERHSEKKPSRVKAKVISNVKRETLHGEIRKHVVPGAELYTDEWVGYKTIEPDYVHNVINHAEEYVRGNVHTNGIENFWSLLKRSIKGTYVSVEPFHLHRYLDEQAFRFNTRKAADSSRMATVVGRVTGRRLTYNALTGNETAS